MELSNSHDLELCKHMVLTTSTALLELQLIMTDIEILDQIKQNMSLMKDKESLHLFVGYLQFDQIPLLSVCKHLIIL